MIDALSGRRFTFFTDPDDLPLELYDSVPIDAHPTTMT